MIQSSSPCQFVQFLSLKKQSVSEGSAARGFRAAQERIFRLKRVRKRKRKRGKMMKSSIGVQLVVNEGHKDAEKELIRKRKAIMKARFQMEIETREWRWRKIRNRPWIGWKMRKWIIEARLGRVNRKAAKKEVQLIRKMMKKANQGKRKEATSFSDHGKGFRQRLRCRSWSKEAADGDRPSLWKKQGFPALQEIKREGMNDVQVESKVIWRTPIGYRGVSSPLRVGKGEVRMRVRRRRRYEGDGALERARWSEILGLHIQCKHGQVIPSKLVLLNTIRDAFLIHNHPSYFSNQKTDCLLVYLLVLIACLVRIRNLVLIPNSIFVKQMEKELSKLAWDSGFIIPNNMSISYSTNKVGINTQGNKVAGNSKVSKKGKACDMNIEGEGFQTPQVEFLDDKLEK